MVGPLPILLADPWRHLAKQNSLLFPLSETAKA